MPVPLSPQAGTTIIIAITITATPRIRVQNGSGAGKGREAKRLRGLFFSSSWVALSTSVIVSRMTSVDTLNDLRYPIGHFSRPASSMAGIRTAHIQTLRLLPERLASSVAGLDDNQLDTP